MVKSDRTLLLSFLVALVFIASTAVIIRITFQKGQTTEYRSQASGGSNPYNTCSGSCRGTCLVGTHPNSESCINTSYVCCVPNPPSPTARPKLKAGESCVQESSLPNSCENCPFGSSGGKCKDKSIFTQIYESATSFYESVVLQKTVIHVGANTECADGVKRTTPGGITWCE